MSRLVFDGMQHTITLYKSSFEVVGSWTAYNRIDNAIKIKGEFTHIPDGTYIIQDQIRPHTHPGTGQDTIDGMYGSYGIVRIHMIGHQGVGVHSGRLYHQPKGPKFVTHGCIRTTEEAMKTIKDLMHEESLETLTVYNNSAQANLLG